MGRGFASAARAAVVLGRRARGMDILVRIDGRKRRVLRRLGRILVVVM